MGLDKHWGSGLYPCCWFLLWPLLLQWDNPSLLSSTAHCSPQYQLQLHFPTPTRDSCQQFYGRQKFRFNRWCFSSPSQKSAFVELLPAAQLLAEQGARLSSNMRPPEGDSWMGVRRSHCLPWSTSSHSHWSRALLSGLPCYRAGNKHCQVVRVSVAMVTQKVWWRDFLFPRWPSHR